MIPVTEYKGRNIAILGLGRTGLAAARALKAGGAKVCAWDEHVPAREKASAEGLTLTDFEDFDWAGCDRLILSPGIPYRFATPHRYVTAAQKAGVPVIGDVELFAAWLNGLPEDARPRLVGITGTNGKSTTTALIGHILTESGLSIALGGNIGTGVLDLPVLGAGGVYVLELSSYQLDLTSGLHCDISLWLNLSPDHLDRHGGFEGYKRAKQRIFQNQTEEDVAILGVDDVHMRSLADQMAHQSWPERILISSQHQQKKGVSLISGVLYDALDQGMHRIGDLDAALALKGTHNHQNAAAAYAACRRLGLSGEAILDALISFPGLAHRLEWVGEQDGVQFYNDSKATNAEATEQALRALGPVYWIAGGQAKEGGIKKLAPYFPFIRKAYLIGEAQDDFADTLSGQADYIKAGDLETAIIQAYRDIKTSGDKQAAILLSPAAASFDQFTSFEHRGDVFKRIVTSLLDADRKAETL